MAVFVLNKQKNPLMPCSERHARLLLEHGRAAVVPSGQKAGTYTGRVAVRATSSYNIQTAESVVQGVSHRYGMLLQRSDGHAYFPQPTTAWNKKEAARQAA
ncbi:MAG: RRXRR domain-containing protein [Candidatus Thiodiazotropha sp.]|jgi:hypothetical protein